MAYFLLGIVLFALAIWVLSQFADADPRWLARVVRRVGGGLAWIFAALMVAMGRFGLAAAAAFAGWLLFRKARSSKKAEAGNGANTTTVRSALFEMCLDHENGNITGDVLAGTYEGRALDSLNTDDLRRLWRETLGEADSRALLEAYLDRRMAGWREDFDAYQDARHDAAAQASAMTEQDAYQILGLAPGASTAEIHKAHRALMKRLHPDHGGSSFLAARVNQAKDFLLRRS